MEIIVVKNAGICLVAQKAIDRMLEEAKKDSVYCIGEIVHNRNVVESLEKVGINFIKKVEESKGTIIIGAHGVSKDIYESIKKTNKEVIDLTCPKVMNVKKIAEEYFEKGYFIIIFGKPNHSEVLGIKSIAKNECVNIANKDQVSETLNRIKDKNRILIISQTTFSSAKFDEIVEEIKKQLKMDVILEVKKTVCSTTEIRQKETKEIAKKVNAMIIVGDKESSNTNELYSIACKYCDNTQFVLNAEELDFSLIKKDDKIGIMAGASTPKEDIYKIKNALLEFEKINKKED